MSRYTFVENCDRPAVREESTGLFVALPEEVVATMMEIEGENPISGVKKAGQWLQERIAQTPEWLAKAPRYASVKLLPQLF